MPTYSSPMTFDPYKFVAQPADREFMQQVRATAEWLFTSRPFNSHAERVTYDKTAGLCPTRYHRLGYIQSGTFCDEYEHLFPMSPQERDVFRQHMEFFNAYYREAFSSP